MDQAMAQAQAMAMAQSLAQAMAQAMAQAQAQASLWEVFMARKKVTKKSSEYKLNVKRIVTICKNCYDEVSLKEFDIPFGQTIYKRGMCKSCKAFFKDNNIEEGA